MAPPPPLLLLALARRSLSVFTYLVMCVSLADCSAPTVPATATFVEGRLPLAVPTPRIGVTSPCRYPMFPATLACTESMLATPADTFPHALLMVPAPVATLPTALEIEPLAAPAVVTALEMLPDATASAPLALAMFEFAVCRVPCPVAMLPWPVCTQQGCLARRKGWRSVSNTT